MPVQRIRFELGDSALPTCAGVRRFDDGGERGAGGAGGLRGDARQAVRPGDGRCRAGWQGSPGALRLQDGAVSDQIAGSVAELLAHQRHAFVEASGEAKPGEEQKHTRCTHSARNSPRCGWIPIWARSASAALSARSMRAACMNAKTARSQLIGGIVYGLGMALLEETHVDGETGRDRERQHRGIPGAGERRRAGHPDNHGAERRAQFESARAPRGSASCRWSASPPPWRTRCITRPACGCASCRYRIEDFSV